MSECRTDRVREILDLAMERPTGERGAFVAGAAGADDAVRVEVMSLLGALDEAGDALEPPGGAPVDGAPAEPLTGLCFGPYVVGERIGEGGMGVVYATRDTRLERTVAVKALPPALVRDPHRRARLEQEARLLASLNHPNIGSIYGVEDTPRGPVMILEFVPGRTLAEEIAARRLSVEESVAIARQIARGLESAHGAGIVHRDLKPTNIKITAEGVVKILDLGVAKIPACAGREPASGPGARGLATQPGMIVGTAAYMSPEQARGRPVDRRTDIWALGCVVYEMLARCRAFDGGTTSDTVAAILTAEPDWSRLSPVTPSGVRRLLSRCLQKDPERRLRDAGDALLDLESAEEIAPTPSSERRWRAATVATALVALTGMAAVYLRTGSRPSAPTTMTRFTIETPLPVRTGVGCFTAFSPDGRTLVYSAGESQWSPQLYLRRLDSFESAAIPGTVGGFEPFFSPDGRWIGYAEATREGTATLKRIPVDGGPARSITAQPAFLFGASWGDDDTIVFSGNSGTLWRVPADGGGATAIGAPADGVTEQHSQPEVLPGSRAVLFTCWRRDGALWHPSIEAVRIDTGQRRLVVAEGSQARLVPGLGMLMFYQGGSLMGAPFDAAGLALTGEARRVIGPLAGDEHGVYSRYAVSGDGILAFLPGDAWSELPDLGWFGVDGTTTTAYRGSLGILSLRLSPDGRRVAFTTKYPEHLWVLDLERGTSVLLTTGGEAKFPVWTPGGDRIAFQYRDRDPDSPFRIEWTLADGSGAPELLYSHAGGTECLPTDFSPDGRFLAISVDIGPSSQSELFLVAMDGTGTAKRLFETHADRVGARFSPDGTMIAYCSTETGREEIWVHPFPALDRKVRVSIEGGVRPAWSGDGKHLFFRYADTIYGADVSPIPELSVGRPAVVLDSLPGMRYDVAPDGTRFIMGRPRGDWAPQTRINVVTGWMAEFRRAEGR